MKKSTKVKLGLTAVCAGASAIAYLCLKKKKSKEVESFYEDFYSEVK